MKIRSAAALAMLVAAPAFAQTTVVLDFEGAPGFVNGIEEFYNGGTDSLGQSGPNYGVSFSSTAVGLSNDAVATYYADAPSPLTVMFALDVDGTTTASTFMNVAVGFVNTLTFAYSAVESGLSLVNIYSGLNGTGSLLASVNLLGNAATGCTGPFCNFDQASVQFAGLARSASFGGGINVLYDDITIAAVPEPSSYLLMALGVAALVGVAKRRRQG